MNTPVTLKTNRCFRTVSLLLIIFILIGILGYVLYLVLTNSNLWDIETVNDADLQFEKVISEENENAANFLPVVHGSTQAESKILDSMPVYENRQFYKWVSKPLSEKELMSDAELLKYIADSTPLVDKFIKASKKSYYHCPLDVYVYPRSETCYVGTIREVAALVILHAEYALRINDIDRAQVLVTSLFDVGELVLKQKNPISLIDYLVGKSVLDVTITLIESNKDLQKLFQYSINKFTLPNDVLTRPMIAEYHIFKSGIYQKEILIEQGFGEFTENPSYSWRPNTTANLYAEYIRAAIVAYATPCEIEPDYSKLEAMRAEFGKDYELFLSDVSEGSFTNFRGDLLKLKIKPNVIGHLILAQSSQDKSNLRDQRCDLNSRIKKISNPI